MRWASCVCCGTPASPALGASPPAQTVGGTERQRSGGDSAVLLPQRQGFLGRKGPVLSSWKEGHSPGAPLVSWNLSSKNLTYVCILGRLAPHTPSPTYAYIHVFAFDPHTYVPRCTWNCLWVTHCASYNVNLVTTAITLSYLGNGREWHLHRLSSEAFHLSVLNMELGDTMDMVWYLWGAKNGKHCQKQEFHPLVPLVVCMGAAQAWKLHRKWPHFRGKHLWGLAGKVKTTHLEKVFAQNFSLFCPRGKVEKMVSKYMHTFIHIHIHVNIYRQYTYAYVYSIYIHIYITIYRNVFIYIHLLYTDAYIYTYIDVHRHIYKCIYL
jgi:hypothetical protein